MFTDFSKESMQEVKTVYINTLGCVRNLVDSEIMAGAIAQAGYRITAAPEAADVIIVNTCGFITAASDESIDTILELAKYKQSGTCRRLIVAGCLPERYREAISEALPEVDSFLGTGALDRVIEAVEAKMPRGGCILPRPESLALSTSRSPRNVSTYPTAYLKIGEGCDRHCTYCIIPRLKGRLRSRPPEDILKEAERLMGAGYSEITLIAQDTSAYGRDLSPRTTLAELLANLASIPGRAWLRFLYGSPAYTDETLIRTVAGTPSILPYFDLPIQHASGKILRRMGRRSQPETLFRLCSDIRRKIPDAVLRTTLLVGFPGETEADFKTLLDFIEAVRFDHVGVFVYSDAEDLASHRLSGHVPAEAAEERRERLMSRQADISLEKNRHRIGATYPVLIENTCDTGLYVGRAPFQAPEVDGVTYVAASGLSIGQFADVRIREAHDYDLEGELA
jgi:ribosomal protein S12 methylthiotransferase